jgi:hypothetical protein
MAVTHPHPNRLAWRRLSSVYRALQPAYGRMMAQELAVDAVAHRLPASAGFAERAAPQLAETYPARGARVLLAVTP